MGLWIKLLNRECSLAFQAEVPLVNRDYLPKILGYRISNFWCESLTYGVYYQNTELQRLAQAIKEKITTDPSFSKRNINDCYRLGDILLKRSAMTDPLELTQFTNSQLLRSLNQFRNAYLNFLPYLVYPHSIERNFMEIISVALKKHLSMISQEKDYERVFETLTTPTIHEIDEQIDLLMVAEKIKSNGWNSENQTEIIKIRDKYSWQPFWTITAKPLTTEYFKNAIQAYVESTADLAHEIKSIKQGQKDRQKQLTNMLTAINATQLLKSYVELLQGYMYLRTYRKNVISNAHYLHLPLLMEIGKRMGIGDDIKLITYEEMLNYLKNGYVVAHSTIEKRKSAWAVLAVNGKISILAGQKSVQSTANKYQIEDVQQQITVKVVQGQPACLGMATGKAKIIMSIKEFEKVNQGDILIAPMTTPDYVPIMKKVSGIVTDEGGVTCHAAIVSREFNIPCIVGTGNATKVFQDGDLIKVNAKTGIAKII